MSIRKYLSVASLACVLPLAGCDENDSNQEDQGVQADGAVVSHHEGSDAAVTGSASGSADGGAVVPTSGDAARPDSPADAGQHTVDPSEGDAGGPALSTAGAKFFLPTGEPTNTAAPRVEVDSAGNTHAVYPAFFKGDAFYTFCSGDCTADPSKLSAVRFETDGTVYNAMLRLTADDKPRVLLSGSKKNYWAQCDQGCTDRANWTLGELQTHNGDLSVTGEALALDPQGRPRFLIHAYRALYGIGQKTPQTSLAQCDVDDCSKPESWTYSVIAQNEIWEGSSLAYDDTGKAHVATHIFSFGDMPSDPIGAYLSCTGACNAEHTWKGIGFFAPYESTTEAIDMHPSISLALSRAGHPRIAQLGKTAEGKKVVSYFECEANCEGDNWKTGFTWQADQFDDGIDLALDASDHPRFVNTINYNIILTYCDAADCTAADAKWDSSFVEKGSDIPTDSIFLEWNCNVGAWFLHSPSLALTPRGEPRVGYQIRDVSGGGAVTPDPTKPSCVAGTDMTLSRLAALPTYKN
ncbi:MAG: hypothetical protein JWN04_6185 [Myxococcaceae bacterium]|nr:hypothetical protein [Myxococcaceae bacterium]